jgi:hypothetical protein
MRKFILIAAMVLASATAQAGQSRGLTLAANDDQPAAATDQAKDQVKDHVKETATPVETPKAAETPKFVDRPAAVDTTTTAAQASKTDAGKPVTTAKADKLRRKNHWTEARIIGELHRHGIYW